MQPYSSQSARSDVVASIIKGRTYECRPGDQGLIFVDRSNKDTPYEPKIASYLPLTTPRLTQRGKVAVHQPEVASKPLVWWKAQCAFRGLRVGGTLAILQQRIREHAHRGLNVHLQEGFAKLEQQYNEQIWSRLDDSGKACALPHRFLSETFGPGTSEPKKVLVVQVHDWAESIQAAAKALGIACEARGLTHFGTGQRLVVLGHDVLQVRAKYAEYERIEARDTYRDKPRMTARRSKPFTTTKKEVTPAANKDEVVASDWNVGGEWEIKCPYIEEQWGDEDRTLALTIGYTEPDRGGLVQIYAVFDFIVFTGILRLVAPSSKAKVQFGLEKSCLPSSQQKRFNFRWRDEAAEEGEIQLGSDEELCSIVFESPHRLHGVFVGNAVGKQKFTGAKVTCKQARVDPDDMWSQRDEVAYEQASRDRWR